MNRKNALITVVVLFVVVAMLFYFLLLENTQEAPVTQPIAEPSTESLQREREQQVAALKELQKTDPEQAKEKAKELFDDLPEKLKRYYKAGFEGGVENITFYGKVVDQEGASVAGAKVWIDVGGRYLAGGSGRAVGTTDSQGRFNVKGVGGSLSIGPIEHPAIDTYRQLSSSGTIEGGAYFTGYQQTVGGNQLLWTDHTDEDNPYVFTVWRRKAGQVASKLYSVDTSTRYNCQGDTYTLDFTQERTKRITKGEANGQLRVRFTCKKKEHSRDEGDWSVELEAVNGGIQETQDVYLNEAPEAGYEPLFHLAMQYGDSNYQRMVAKRFYFMAENGQYYGSLEAKFIPYIYDDPKIDMKFKLNPKGSRILVSNK